MHIHAYFMGNRISYAEISTLWHEAQGWPQQDAPTPRIPAGHASPHSS